MENETLLSRLKGQKMPQHVGIIMDGNGRWAQKRFLPRSAGHKEGAQTFGKIARFARDCGIDYITFFTFSTENWKRPKDEVDGLMDLLHKFLQDSYKYKDENIHLRFLGDLQPLRPEILHEIERVSHESQQNTGITVNIAINYGGRDEIVRATQKICSKILQEGFSPDRIDESFFSSYLDTAGMPDCDLIIRPSGEMRLSNFLLWQAAYAEFIFMDVLWPDFTEENFVNALLEYTRRTRRFGGI